MVSEDRCRRDSGQDSDTLASDKWSFCLVLYVAQGRAEHIRRRQAAIIHLSWTTKNNFLAVPGRLMTSLLCRQIQCLCYRLIWPRAQASGECSTVIVMPLWDNRPGLQTPWSEAKTGEWTRNTAGTVNKRLHSIYRCNNWWCDFGCQRFHWSSRGVKLTIVARPNFSSFVRS